MRYDVRPEPRDAREREALERALRRLLGGERVPRAYRSRWREAGLDFGTPYVAVRPRSRPGATRA